ncbi:MAG: thiolase family protein [Bacillota bacterium]|nr:thiolase family protein [Bacillota bacterium]
MYAKAFIPFRGYYSSPFSRWQGTLQNENSIELGANTAKRWLATKNFDPKMIDYVVFGKSIGQHHSFYGSTWAGALLGADKVSAVHISQACSTSTTCLNLAAMSVETDNLGLAFCLMTDRCSNGPHTIWPNSKGPGGEVISENWMMDNFNADPWVGLPMIKTAENAAASIEGVTKELCDEVALRRYEQYQDALANDREFQKRYMFPVEYKISKKETGILETDEGVTERTKEGLSALRSFLPGGVHSSGSQTHPADGNCAFIVTTREKAQELSADKNVEIQIVSYGFTRVDKGFMAAAPVPAAENALKNAGLTLKDIKVIKTHNPFIANDVYMSKKMGIDPMTFNNYGSSMIFGHPQGPTAGRCIAEMIEELVMVGGGYGLFTGCAAGDTGAGLIVKVTG